jgi:chromosome segregation ATPase
VGSHTLGNVTADKQQIENQFNLKIELLQKELQRVHRELEEAQKQALERQNELNALQKEHQTLLHVTEQLRTEKEAWLRTQTELNAELTALREKCRQPTVDPYAHEEALKQIVELKRQLIAAEGVFNVCMCVLVCTTANGLILFLIEFVLIDCLIDWLVQYYCRTYRSSSKRE